MKNVLEKEFVGVDCHKDTIACYCNGKFKEFKTNFKGFKKALDEAGVEEMKIGVFTVRFTNVVRNNFNTTAFKKKYLELYNAFIKQTNYRKFTIA